MVWVFVLVMVCFGGFRGGMFEGLGGGDGKRKRY